MRTYRDLFGEAEFRSLFLATGLQVAGQAISGLALGTLVFAATSSPLLSALAMFGPALAQAAGALTLLSAADRVPPRLALTALGIIAAIGTAVQAVPWLPVWGIFAVLLAEGLIGSAGGGVRYGLLNEILPPGGYLLGRSVINMSVGLTQIAGFGAGGLLLMVLSPRAALLAGAGMYLIAAAVIRIGLDPRPARVSGRPSVAATVRTDRLLLSTAPVRYVYLAMWVPNGLIVGCESLFVAYSPRHAGLMYAFTAAGMLAGDTVAGRFLPPAWREHLIGPLRLLLAVPYLVFAFGPPLPLAIAAAAIASVGYAASLLLQQRLLALTAAELSGQALGLHSSGMLAAQGAAAALAGSIAQVSSPATAIAILALTSVIVTLLLTPGLRPDDPVSRADPAPDAG